MNLSLLIHTFNGYQHLWEGQWRSFLTHWAVMKVRPFFGTDLPQREHPVQVGEMIYSGPGEWSDRLTRLLERIPTDYVLYMQEDHWLTRSPPDLSELMQIVTQNDLFRLQLSPNSDYYTTRQRGNLHYFKSKSKYLVSHQPSIWKKSFLLSCLQPGETPWVNEYEGTKRLNNSPEIKNKIALYPCNWYAHKCVRGKVQ